MLSSNSSTNNAEHRETRKKWFIWVIRSVLLQPKILLLQEKGGPLRPVRVKECQADDDTLTDAPVEDACRRGVALLLWGLLLAYSASPAQASTITVNSKLDDELPDDGLCTLREAIISANDNAVSGATAGECAAGSVSGTDLTDIEVTGTVNTVNLTKPLPSLSSNMEIEGPGADQLTVGRDTGGNYRIFGVTSGSVVSISGITITKGNVPGGGILNNGTLTITDSTISANSADQGGVFSDTDLSGLKTTITNSTISGNSATDAGGGVFNYIGLTVIEHSTITKNTAPTVREAGWQASGTPKPARRCSLLSSPPTPTQTWTLSSLAPTPSIPTATTS
jgi:CSLREA domain-containing protein